MRLKRLLNQITPLPWLFCSASDGDKWIGTIEGDDRITTLDGNTRSIDHDYLVHAANVLPELLAAAKNVQENWEHNLTEPMARLNEAIEIAEDINTTALRAKPRKHG
jgi:hypothetical protein